MNTILTEEGCGDMKWHVGTQKPSKNGTYLVLVKLIHGGDLEYDLADYNPEFENDWSTRIYIGTVVRWTDLPNKRALVGASRIEHVCI